MRASQLFRFTLFVLALAGSGPVSAGWVNELGRDLGLGWSDGYHAYEGCPNSRMRSQPWQRRASRQGPQEEPLVPYLEPVPAPRPAPEALPSAKTSAANAPAISPQPPRSTRLHISRPNY